MRTTQSRVRYGRDDAADLAVHRPSDGKLEPHQLWAARKRLTRLYGWTLASFELAAQPS